MDWSFGVIINRTYALINSLQASILLTLSEKLQCGTILHRFTGWRSWSWYWMVKLIENYSNCFTNGHHLPKSTKNRGCCLFMPGNKDAKGSLWDHKWKKKKFKCKELLKAFCQWIIQLNMIQQDSMKVPYKWASCCNSVWKPIAMGSSIQDEWPHQLLVPKPLCRVLRWVI